MCNGNLKSFVIARSVFALRAVGIATKQSPRISGDCFACARNDTSGEVSDC